MLEFISAIGIGKVDSGESVVMGPNKDASPLPRCLGFSVFSIIISLLLYIHFPAPTVASGHFANYTLSMPLKNISVFVTNTLQHYQKKLYILQENVSRETIVPGLKPRPLSAQSFHFL
jgi:hypothetical protein